MKGKDLQKAIKNSGRSIVDILKDTKIPKSTFFTLYKEDEVPSHYIEKIKASGVNLDYSGLSDPAESKEFLKARLLLMEQNANDLKELIEVLKGNVEDLRTNNQTLNKVVNRQLDQKT